MLQSLIGATFNVHARVGRGAELLDDHRPGWAPEIDVERLDMKDIGDCLLGQLYGEYRSGCDALALDTGAASAEHGFNSGWIFLCPAPLIGIAWLFGSARALLRREDRLLRDAWVAAIRERTERERPRARSLLHQCGTDGASLANVANGTPSFVLIE